MADRPETPAAWAANADPGRVASKTDLDAFRAGGWPVRWTPVSSLLNRVLVELYDWVDYLAGGAVFDSAAAGVASGADSFIVAGTDRPFSAVVGAYGNDTWTPIAICAERCYITRNDGGGTVVDAWSLTAAAGAPVLGFESPVWTSTPSVASTSYIETNGRVVALRASNDNDTLILDATTGDELFTIPTPAGDYVVAVALTDDRIFRALYDGSTYSTIDFTSLAGGATTSLTLPSAQEVYDIAVVDGSPQYLAVVHSAVSGDDLTLFRIQPLDSPVLANVWAESITTATGAQVVTDGRLLYVWRGDTNALVNAYAIGDGELVWSTNVGSATGAGTIACDATSVYLVKDLEHELLALDARTGALLRPPIALSGSGLGVFAQHTPVASNSQVVVVPFDNGANLGLSAYRTNIGTRRWSRVARSPNFLQAAPEAL